MSQRLLLVYPEAWRERYGEEMGALLKETPPSLSATLDLLRGALIAHLRGRPAPPPARRARTTVGYVLGAFILFCVFGSGFAKTTENYDLTERLHPLLGVCHSVISTTALVAAGALVLAAAPLALTSLVEARRTRDPRLMKLISVPPTAIAVFAGSVALLVLWLNAHHHRADVGAWLLLGLCALCGAAGSFACWAASRAIMARVELPRAAFKLSLPALGVVALCMAAAALATGAFLIGIVLDAPGVGASGNGPGQLVDVTTSIAVQFAGMLALSAGALVSAARGLRSIRV